MARAFDIIDHTADVGIVARGRTLEELFGNAALGMFSVIGDVTSVQPRETREVSVRADSRRLLLAAFLNDLLYLFSVGRFVLHHAAVDRLADGEVHAVVHGEPLAPHHCLRTEIKAVTHHRLTVEKRKGGWRATVLFDV